MNKQEIIETIENGYSSIYTKDDVIKLINLLDTKSTSIDLETIRPHLQQWLYDKINGFDSSDLVDYGSANFDVCNNYIELNSIDLNINHSLIKDVVDAWVDAFKSDNDIEDTDS